MWKVFLNEATRFLPNHVSVSKASFVNSWCTECKRDWN